MASAYQPKPVPVGASAKQSEEKKKEIDSLPQPPAEMNNEQKEAVKTVPSRQEEGTYTESKELELQWMNNTAMMTINDRE